ncbi:response regulator [Kiloniella sp.]|uniref:response regulator n=1 Tax=Kiloniella sp. TaxID=1938587 RepID=UPI003B020AFF
MNKYYDLQDIDFLIVDDNLVMQQILKTILRSFNARNPRVASNQEEAIEALSHKSADIVIIDLDISPQSRVDLLKALRTEETSPAPFTQIIVITAFPEKEHVTQARDHGMNEFLAKPLSPAGLYQKISRIIAHPRPFIRLEGYTGPCRRRRRPDGSVPEDSRRSQNITFIPDDTFPWNRDFKMISL